MQLSLEKKSVISKPTAVFPLKSNLSEKEPRNEKPSLKGARGQERRKSPLSKIQEVGAQSQDKTTTFNLKSSLVIREQMFDSKPTAIESMTTTTHVSAEQKRKLINKISDSKPHLKETKTRSKIDLRRDLRQNFGVKSFIYAKQTAVSKTEFAASKKKSSELKRADPRSSDPFKKAIQEVIEATKGEVTKMLFKKHPKHIISGMTKPVNYSVKTYGLHIRQARPQDQDRAKIKQDSKVPPSSPFKTRPNRIIPSVHEFINSHNEKAKFYMNADYKVNDRKIDCKPLKKPEPANLVGQKYEAEYGSNWPVYKSFASHKSVMSNCFKNKYEEHFAIYEQKSSKDQNQGSRSDQKDLSFEDSLIFYNKKRSTISATKLHPAPQPPAQSPDKDHSKPLLAQKPFKEDVNQVPSVNFFSEDRRTNPELSLLFKIDFHRNNFFDLMNSQRKNSKESKDSNAKQLAVGTRGANEIRVTVLEPSSEKARGENDGLGQAIQLTNKFTKPGEHHRSDSEPWMFSKNDFIRQCGFDIAEQEECPNDSKLNKDSHEFLSREMADSNVTYGLKYRKELISKINSFKSQLPQLPDLAFISQASAPIDCFAANSYKGLTREANEDRIVAHFNVTSAPSDSNRFEPFNRRQYHLVSLFDGHAGIDCAEYLAGHLHPRLMDDLIQNGISHIALGKIFDQIDRSYLDFEKSSCKNYSGSCACTMIVSEKKLVVLNVGDSRCVLSIKGGKQVISMTNDHKPDRISELSRIFKNGGFVSRVYTHNKTGKSEVFSASSIEEFKQIESSKAVENFVASGPWRIAPMKISVSRAFGDRGAKDPAIGGHPGIIISKPEISEHKLENCDFALLACELISRWRIRQHNQL